MPGFIGKEVRTALSEKLSFGNIVLADDVV